MTTHTESTESTDSGPTVLDVAERSRFEIHADGRVWCGPGVWDGAAAMRISVSSWKSGPADAAVAVEAILECAAQARKSASRT